jgi:hypothetical protein
MRVIGWIGGGILLMLAAGWSAGGIADGPASNTALAGEYRHQAISATGKVRRSVATIAPRGAGLGVAWEEDEGNLFGGIGLSLDGVFGAAYTEALNGAFRGSGMVAYRIAGGTLTGIRLHAGAEGATITETLQGPAGLDGSYEIVSSQAADGSTFHGGRVEIAHRGDTYQMTWFTTEATLEGERSFEGVGLRIGDVLVASYARGFAPGILAYCIDDGLLSGIATYGHIGTIAQDRMVRGGTAEVEPSARCRDAIGRWNPSLGGG